MQQSWANLRNYGPDHLGLQVCDFTVMVRGLPPKTSIVAIKKHFELLASIANSAASRRRDRHFTDNPSSSY